MKAAAFGLSCATVVAACASPPAEPIVRAVEVKVPVAVPCKPDLGPAPSYPDTHARLKAEPDLFGRVKLLLAGRELRDAWIGAQAKALRACAQTGGGQ